MNRYLISLIAKRGEHLDFLTSRDLDRLHNTKKASTNSPEGAHKQCRASDCIAYLVPHNRSPGSTTFQPFDEVQGVLH